MWSHCTDLVNLTFEWTARISFVFPGKEKQEVKWQAVRLFLAAFAMLFNMLGGDMGKDDPFKVRVGSSRE